MPKRSAARRGIAIPVGAGPLFADPGDERGDSRLIGIRLRPLLRAYWDLTPHRRRHFLWWIASSVAAELKWLALEANDPTPLAEAAWEVVRPMLPSLIPLIKGAEQNAITKAMRRRNRKPRHDTLDLGRAACELADSAPGKTLEGAVMDLKGRYPSVTKSKVVNSLRQYCRAEGLTSPYSRK
jgi:hypothetical protein